METYKDTHLNPAEARLRARPRPLEAVGPLAGQYKGQDEGGLAAMKSLETRQRRGVAAENRFRLQKARQQG
ncbi:MAG: hypothetical protein P4L72_05545 [Parvibaculum sp.]|jgi:hypothetical protein|uniref:hypothetical protein n=1 Tax=Parvibaculum sp. TaxID=2024848 RepID=UPI002848EBF0|nr:hypothetical protein [Parvibaculum sp.]MDR3498676.1 hypothetical protein [Parvibaculum sp.]